MQVFIVYRGEEHERTQKPNSAYCLLGLRVARNCSWLFYVYILYNTQGVHIKSIPKQN